MQPIAQDDYRAKRWADFRNRVECSPQSVYRHRTRGWEYLPIHPFGDECEDLERLGLRPEDCCSADAWWGIDCDATLLESTIANRSDHPPGLYAKATPHAERWIYLVAVLDAPFVSRLAFEEAMIRFAFAGFPGDPRFQLDWGDPWLALDFD